jgi:hypothetical protein
MYFTDVPSLPDAPSASLTRDVEAKPPDRTSVAARVGPLPSGPFDQQLGG